MDSLGKFATYGVEFTIEDDYGNKNKFELVTIDKKLCCLSNREIVQKRDMFWIYNLTISDNLPVNGPEKCEIPLYKSIYRTLSLPYLLKKKMKDKRRGMIKERVKIKPFKAEFDTGMISYFPLGYSVYTSGMIWHFSGLSGLAYST